MIPAYIAGMKNKEAHNRAEELLEFMGLNDRANHKPNELSGGEKAACGSGKGANEQPCSNSCRRTVG